MSRWELMGMEMKETSEWSFRMPEWAKEVMARYESGSAGVFVLHGNVSDRVRLPGSAGGGYGSLGDFLRRVLLPRFGVLLEYDPGTGLRVERGRELMAEWPGWKDWGSGMPEGPLAAMRFLARYFGYVRNLRALGRGGPTVAVVMKEADLWWGAGAGGGGQEGAAMVALWRAWAGEMSLAEQGMVVMVVAERLHGLHPRVVGHPRVATVGVPLPGEEELEEALSWLEPQCGGAFGGGVERGRLAGRFKGTTLGALEAMLRWRHHRAEPLREADLGAMRRAMVERDAGGLIEFLEPKRNLDAVVGLEEVKRRLRQDLELWRRDEIEALPKGYLFCGPVGTGKTFLVECLAGEAGVPVVVMRNFRERWVGATEANLEKIFELLHALGRCVVFVDEADQALGRRETGGGDGGVSARVYSMMAAEMAAPENRGRILWVLASSRPDLIEVDLKRPGRVDVKVPIFPAVNREEGWALLEGLAFRKGLAWTEEERESLWEKLPEWLTPGAAEALAVEVFRRVRTGNRGAAECLEEVFSGYRPPVAMERLMEQMRLAVEETTDPGFVPAEVENLLGGRGWQR